MADDTNVSELLKQVNDNLKKANEDLLPKAENALKEAKNAGELSQKTKDEVDKALTEFNALAVAQNALQTELGEAVQLFARGKNGGVQSQLKRLVKWWSITQTVSKTSVQTLNKVSVTALVYKVP